MPLLGLPGGRLGATRQTKNNALIYPAGLGVTSVAASATPHTKGSWVQLDSGSLLVADSAWLLLGFGTNFSAGVRRDVLIDIGTGATGQETVLIENLSVGYRRTLVGNDMGAGYWACIPIRCTAQKLVARAQSSTGSQTTAISSGWWIGQPPAGWVPFQSSFTIGADLANSRGTVVTGKTFLNSPTQVAFNPTRVARSFAVSLGLAGTTAATAQEVCVAIEINGANEYQYPFYSNSDESIVGPFPNAMLPVEHPVTPSDTVDVRIYVNNTQQDFDVCVHYFV